MFNYFMRLSLMFDLNVASFAILADETPQWCPAEFKTELLGCSCKFEFPVCKLLEVVKERPALDQSKSPAALIILANRIGQLTAHDPVERYRLRKELTISLYDKGLSVEETNALVHFYDWLLKLPDALDQEFYEEIKSIEEEKHMPYMMEMEKRAMAKGSEEGKITTLQESIQAILKVRFKSVNKETSKLIAEIEDVNRLKSALKLAAACPNLKSFQSKL